MANLEDVKKAIEELHETIRDGGSGSGGSPTTAAANTPGSAGEAGKKPGGGLGIPSSLKTLGGIATVGTFGKALGAGADSLFRSGGDTSAAGGGFTRAVHRVASSVPGLGQAFGSSQSTGILDRAQGNISNIAGSLARAGVELSPGQLKKVVGRQLKIEKRVQDATDAVQSEVDRQSRKPQEDSAPDIPGLAEFLVKVDELTAAFGRLVDKVERYIGKFF